MSQIVNNNNTNNNTNNLSENSSYNNIKVKNTTSRKDVQNLELWLTNIS